METKKKLRMDLNGLFEGLRRLEKWVHQISDKVDEFEAKEKAKADLITAKEAAKLLGYNTRFISSRLLTQKGIKHSKNQYGFLEVSRKSVEEYLESRTKTNED